MKFAIAVCVLLAMYAAPCVLPFGWGATHASAPAADQHQEWVAASLKEMQSIKVGMKRAEVEKVFGTEGGLAERLHRTYVYRHCSYFKVDVDFSAAESGSDQDDRVVRISAPYLAWPKGD